MTRSHARAIRPPLGAANRLSRRCCPNGVGPREFATPLSRPYRSANWSTACWPNRKITTARWQVLPCRRRCRWRQPCP
jgi:hypothetical protein